MTAESPGEGPIAERILLISFLCELLKEHETDVAAYRVDDNLAVYMALAGPIERFESEGTDYYSGEHSFVMARIATDGTRQVAVAFGDLQQPFSIYNLTPAPEELETVSEATSEVDAHARFRLGRTNFDRKYAERFAYVAFDDPNVSPDWIDFLSPDSSNESEA